MPYIQSGKLNVIAVTSANRSPLLPNVPTIGETFPGYDSDTWVGVFVPNGTPAPIISKINTAFNETLYDPGVKARLEKQGISIAAGSPQELDRIVSRDVSQFSQVVKEQGIKTE